MAIDQTNEVIPHFGKKNKKTIIVTYIVEDVFIRMCKL